MKALRADGSCRPSRGGPSLVNVRDADRLEPRERGEDPLLAGVGAHTPIHARRTGRGLSSASAGGGGAGCGDARWLAGPEPPQRA